MIFSPSSFLLWNLIPQRVFISQKTLNTRVSLYLSLSYDRYEHQGEN